MRILVIGVGGCGINAINHMIASGLQGVVFIAADTDAGDLAKTRAEHTILLGPTYCKGLGASHIPRVGRQAAEESLPAIKDAIGGADMVFVVAGMGGGTGTTAGAIIAKAAKDAGALTVGVVSKPFAFGGKRRRKLAEMGMQAFLDTGDSLIVIPNDKLLQLVPKKTSYLDVLRKSDDALYHAVRCVSGPVSGPPQQDLIAFDFIDLRDVLSGKAVMGTGSASGEHRARIAAKGALNCPLIEDTPIGDLCGLLYTITASEDITGDEIMEVGTIIGDAVHPEANVFVQVCYDENAGEKLRVTLIGILGTGAKESASAAGYAPGEEDFIFDEEKFKLPTFIRKAVDDSGSSDFIWRDKDGFPYLVRIDSPLFHIEPIAESTKNIIKSQERSNNPQQRNTMTTKKDTAPAELNTPGEWLETVQQDGMMLQYVPEELKTPELCLIAVQQNGMALDGVPEELKTPNLCLAAIQQDGWALQYVPRKLKTLEICLAAVQNDPAALWCVPKTFKKEMRAAVKRARAESSAT